jgi:FKBP-type peptidyl-prolyl cis-trans isomerase
MSKTHRVGSFVLALFLIISTVGAVLLVVFQSQQQDEQNSAQEDAQNSLNESEQSTNENATPEEGKLEGTQLAGYTPTDQRITELKYEDLVEGSGAEVLASSTVTADYTGALATTGIIFQSSLDTGQPFTAPLSNLIQGWQQGMPGMKVGGTRRLFIPANLAYGATGQGNIPPDSDLVFDIVLISVQ